MAAPLSIVAIQADPRCIAFDIQTPSGLMVTFRPLEPQDHLMLGQYFLSLSETTKSLYAPHPFDQATANQLCAHIDYADTIRMIATLPTTVGEQVIAYFILMLSVPEHELQRYVKAGVSIDPQVGCLVAPSVADAYQDQGLGSPLMRRMFHLAYSLGRRYMLLMGGVYVHNARAVHYYQKLGFKTVGSFVSPSSGERASYDMYLDLEGVPPL
jgi:ribosomal protein S18 acetylase RimI-like enzyme